MDQAPAQPPERTGELDRPGLQQGVTAADVGRRAQIPITVVLAAAPGEIPPDAGGGMQSALHGVLRHPGQPVPPGEVTDDEHIAVARHGEVGIHGDPPGPVGLCTERLGGMARERHRLDTGRPQHRAHRMVGTRAAVLGGHGDPVAAHVGDVHTEMQIHAQVFEHTLRAVGQRRGETLQHPVAAVEQQHARVPRRDAVEFVGQRPRRQFADLPGQFHTGGPAARDGEGQPLVSFRPRRQRLGDLESGEHPPSDAQRIVEGLHARRPRRELLVTEVGLAHARRDHQIVVVHVEERFVGTTGGDAARVGIETNRLAEKRRHIVVLGQLLAQRPTDLPDAERARRTLVQQRLKHMACRPVEQSDVHPDLAEPTGAEQAAESTADDEDLGPAVA